MTKARSPLRGWPVTVVRRVRAASVFQAGLVTTALHHALVVEAESLEGWSPNESAVIAAGEHGARLVTLSRVAAVKGNRAILSAPGLSFGSRFP